jgi:hypothetical protein
VVRGSMHDNPLRITEGPGPDPQPVRDDLWRQAREFGDFVDMGGLIYPEWERPRPSAGPGAGQVVGDPVGIDPGIRNAGFAFVGFDDENVATSSMRASCRTRRSRITRSSSARSSRYWGIELEDVTFVIDPAARSRSQVNAETVQSALAGGCLLRARPERR